MRRSLCACEHALARHMKASTPSREPEVGPCRSAFQDVLLYLGHGRMDSSARTAAGFANEPVQAASQVVSIIRAAFIEWRAWQVPARLCKTAGRGGYRLPYVRKPVRSQACHARSMMCDHRRQVVGRIPVDVVVAVRLDDAAVRRGCRYGIAGHERSAEVA